MTTPTKTCKTCGETKPVEEFYLHRNQCKKCILRENEKRRVANPKKARESRKKWRAANIERTRESDKKWRASNIERTRGYNKKWRVANPESAKKSWADWHIRNPDSEREKSRRKVENLKAFYVAQILQIPVSTLRQYPDLLECHREVIRLKRKFLEHNKTQTI